MKTILKRMRRPTPRFFQQVRTISAVVAGTGILLLLIPVAVSAVLLKIAGGLILTGIVAGVVSQTAVKYERR